MRKMSFFLLIKSHKGFNKEREEEKGWGVKNIPRRVKNINRHTDICRYIYEEQNSLSGWFMEENKGKWYRPSDDFPLVLWPCALKCLKMSFFQDYYFSLCFSLGSVCVWWGARVGERLQWSGAGQEIPGVPSHLRLNGLCKRSQWLGEKSKTICFLQN